MVSGFGGIRRKEVNITTKPALLLYAKEVGEEIDVG